MCTNYIGANSPDVHMFRQIANPNWTNRLYAGTLRSKYIFVYVRVCVWDTDGSVCGAFGARSAIKTSEMPAERVYLR